MRPHRAAALALAAALGARGAAVEARPNCTASIPNVSFGNYDTINSVTVAGQFLTIKCKGSGKFNVSAALSIGSGSYAARTMTAPGSPDTLLYNLYADSAHTQILGNGTSGTVALGPTAVSLGGHGATQTLTYAVYPYLPGLQNVTPGSYGASAITVTVSY